ncbi:MAG: ROK family protein, partial [Oscillospiraceae bacterium]|nr:ROK family protein [Oscillospiraceae bacterium]
ITKVNAKVSFDGMRAKDALATQVVNNFLDYVACGITNIVNTFQPEILCVGGGISKEGETLLQPVRERLDKEEYNRTGTRRTKLVTALLRNDAGIIGAALLGTQKR